METTPLSSLTTALVLSLTIFHTISPFISATKEGLVLEDGYEVTTVINGHELKRNPHSVIPNPGSSQLILLDSSASSFYTLPFPFPQDGSIKRLAGIDRGFKDGDLGSAMFDKPRSFAVDLKGNVYVADQANHAIRKISNSRGAMHVTTIAGGYSYEPGSEDGPAQNATFSSDFTLLFVPDICALLIADHGNQLIRQIDLKEEDCAKGSKPALETASLWILALVVSCLISIVIGVAIGSYLVPQEGFRRLHFSSTWKRYLMNLLKVVPQMLCCDIRSAVANSRLFALLRRLLQLCVSHLSLMFMINPFGSQSSNKDYVSLLESYVNSPKVEKSQMCDQLKDLIDLGNDLQLANTKMQILGKADGDENSVDVLPNVQGKLDGMIQANIAGFAQVARETSQLDRCLAGASGLVKRGVSS